MSGPTPRLAPAKINLALHVTGQRADGYHLIETLVVFADVGDRLTVEPAEADGFGISGPFGAGLPADGGNLVIAARDRLRASASGTTPGVRIGLEKNLPVASGIGGGSSDAAAALRALSEFWGLDLSHHTHGEIGAALGADVPMCLDGRPLVARGIGERLAPLDHWPALDMVLVNPGVAVSTPAVFKRLERRDGLPLEPVPTRPGLTDALDWLRRMRNDLEPPARSLAPEIGTALDALTGAGAALARMSGSGATCFGIFADGAAARAAAARIEAATPGWFVAATQTGGTSP